MARTTLAALAVALLSLDPAAHAAEYANPRLLVEPAEVEKNAKTWIVLDCRDVRSTVEAKTNRALKGYADGHIPGAVTLGGDCSKVLREKETSTVFTDPKKYADILGRAGIGRNRTVVVYGDLPRITHAAVGFWILEWLGQKDVRFLNGGIEAWVAAGKELVATEKAAAPASYESAVAHARIATTEEVLEIAKGKKGGAQLVDSRTPAEHAGTDVRAKRGGHIPNTRVNVSHVEIFDAATGRLKPMPALEALYGGLDKRSRVIAYCQTGTRSALAYLAFRVMGFKDPSNYDDSWIIWGNRDDLPVEK